MNTECLHSFDALHCRNRPICEFDAFVCINIFKIFFNFFIFSVKSFTYPWIIWWSSDPKEKKEPPVEEFFIQNWSQHLVICKISKLMIYQYFIGFLIKKPFSFWGTGSFADPPSSHKILVCSKVKINIGKIVKHRSCPLKFLIK